MTPEQHRKFKELAHPLMELMMKIYGDKLLSVQMDTDGMVYILRDAADYAPYEELSVDYASHTKKKSIKGVK